MKISLYCVLCSVVILASTIGAVPAHNSSVLYKDNISFVQAINPPSDKNSAPVFSWFDAKGKTISLNDLKGEIVFINFWATWCPPCCMELPDIVSLSKKYKGKVDFIGIALERQKENVLENLHGFAKSNGIKYQIVVGSDELANAYGGISGIPTTFIVDRNGKIVSSAVGEQSREAFEKMIKDAL